MPQKSCSLPVAASPWSSRGEFLGPPPDSECTFRNAILFVGNKFSIETYVDEFRHTNYHLVSYTKPSNNLLQTEGLVIYTPDGKPWTAELKAKFGDPGNMATPSDVLEMRSHAEANCAIFKRNGSQNYGVTCQHGRNRSQCHAAFVREILSETTSFVGCNEDDSSFREKYLCGLLDTVENKVSTRQFRKRKQTNST